MEVAETDSFAGQPVEVRSEAGQSGGLERGFQGVLAVRRISGRIVAVLLAGPSHVTHSLIIGEDQDDIGTTAVIALRAWAEAAEQDHRYCQDDRLQQAISPVMIPDKRVPRSCRNLPSGRQPVATSA